MQCYGSPPIFHECTYALLSLSRLYSASELAHTEIWLYTDNPGWFRSLKKCTLPLHYREIDAATIKQWRGRIDFVHRVKVEALKDFVKGRTGNIIYLDTDVVITHRLDKVWRQIEAGALYMHVMEGYVHDAGNAVMAKLNKYLTANDKTIDGKPLNSFAMWNAGVLGFNTRHSELLDEVLAFTDNEYPHFAKHIIEQFAFSVSLGRQEAIKAAAPCIMHYWNLKEARKALADFFDHFSNESWGTLAAYAPLIQMHVLMQEKVNFLHNRSIVDKLRGKKWHPAPQNWERLINQV